ncbi:MAG: SGNH/GDSL hydrolase family protein [Acidobacteria bacterium]|nr:MAG: SGNH/GDSL hydrolase family protein [Acidobacteriota bacterium]
MANDTRGRDARRELADELAELLATPEGMRTARLLQVLGLLGAPGAGGDDREEPGGDEPRAIGIWQPRQVDGELIFERPPPHPLGDHYAATRVLRAAKPAGRRRVVLLGESVAAGYLYAPHLTPAMVLDRHLRRAAGEAYEVVDLARTNERLATLARTAESAQQLEPDVLVIFAGNNWNLLETPEISPFAPSVRARQAYALALRQAGLAGPVGLAARRLRRVVEEAFERIARLASERWMPVIVVIPEVDLERWQNRQPVPYLPGDGVARWYRAYEQAVEELERGAFAAAAAGARALLALDDVCPTGHLLLARALAGLGRRKAARAAARAAVDRGTYPTLAFLGSPQITSLAATLLAAQASRHGLRAVDLRRVFAAGRDRVPGGELFLDYCHLSAGGMGLAMAAVAAEILAHDGRGSSWQELLDDRPSPAVAPEVEATARLGAAVHAAHRQLTVGDPLPELERACRAALEADPRIAATMGDLLRVRCTPCPAILTAAQGRNLDSPHRLLLQHGWRWSHLDLDLLEALCRALEREEPTVRIRLADELLRHHDLPPEGRELARPPYLWSPVERFLPEAMEHVDLPPRATCRAPWPSTRFCLPCDGARDVELSLTARLPAASAPADVVLKLGGRPFASVTLGSAWKAKRVRVPATLLRRGANRLTLRWPLPGDLGPAPLEPVLRRLEQGYEAEIHPTFGEVFSLLARYAG